MANPYDPPELPASYDLDPPTDNGANTANNEVKWEKHIEKIGDPLVEFNEDDVAETLSAFAKIIGGGDIIPVAVDRTGVESDQGKAIQVSVSGTTATTPDAEIVKEPFYFIVQNIADDVIFIDGNGTQTVNDSALPIAVGPGEGTLVYTDGDNWFVLSENLILPIGAGIVPTAVNRTFIPADRGKLIRVTAPDKTLTLDDAALFTDKTVFKFTNNSTGKATLAVFGSQTYNGDPGPFTVPPKRGGEVWTDGSNWFGPGFNFQQQLMRSHLAGLGTSNSTGDASHDILIAEGEARDRLNLFDFKLSSALTKRIDFAWSPGSGAGGRAANLTLLPNTWYHGHLVLTDSGAVDFGFDTSFTASNLLNNTSGIASGSEGRHRRIWSFLTDGNMNIYKYRQVGDECIWDYMNDHLVMNETLLIAGEIKTAHVPPNMKIWSTVLFNGIGGNSNGLIHISDPDATNNPTDFTFAGGNNLNGNGMFNSDLSRNIVVVSCFTNTIRQIRIRGNVSGNPFVEVAQIGYRDTRGRFD